MNFILAPFATSRALAAAGLMGLLLLAITVWVSAAQNDPAYFSDGWWMLRWIREFERGQISLAGYIFHPHGEHYHSLILALYLIDWNVFGGTQTFIAVVGYLSSVAVFGLLACAAARMPGPDLYRAAVILLAGAMIAGLQGFETWYLQFQAVLSSARLLASASIMLVALGLVSRRAAFSYAGIVLASIAIFAHGTVMPLVVMIPAMPFLFRRWRLAAAGLLVPVGFFAMVVPYTLGLIGFAGHNSPALFAPQRMWEILCGAAILTGSAFTRDMTTAMALGAIGLVASVAVGLLAVRDVLRRPEDASFGTVFFLGFGALSLADAFLAAVLAALRANYFGPGSFDYDSLMVSRYFMTATGVWVSLAALAGGFASLWRARYAAWIGTAAVGTLALVIQLASIDALRGIHQSLFSRRGHAALLAEVYDPETIDALIRPGDFQAEIPALNHVFQERRRNVYAAAVPTIAVGRVKTLGREQSVEGGCKFLAAVDMASPAPVVRTDGAALAYEDRGAIAKIEDFDGERYGRENPDVAKALGTDREALWRHWSTAGVFEGRTTPLRSGGTVAALYTAYSRKPCGALGLEQFRPRP